MPYTAVNDLMDFPFQFGEMNRLPAVTHVPIAALDGGVPWVTYGPFTKLPTKYPNSDHQVCTFSRSCHSRVKIASQTSALQCPPHQHIKATHLSLFAFQPSLFLMFSCWSIQVFGVAGIHTHMINHITTYAKSVSRAAENDPGIRRMTSALTTGADHVPPQPRLVKSKNNPSTLYPFSFIVRHAWPFHFRQRKLTFHTCSASIDHAPHPFAFVDLRVRTCVTSSALQLFMSLRSCFPRTSSFETVTNPAPRCRNCYFCICRIYILSVNRTRAPHFLLHSYTLSSYSSPFQPSSCLNSSSTTMPPVFFIPQRLHLSYQSFHYFLHHRV
jgi:hypothetical protein